MRMSSPLVILLLTCVAAGACTLTRDGSADPKGPAEKKAATGAASNSISQLSASAVVAQKMPNIGAVRAWVTAARATADSDAGAGRSLKVSSEITPTGETVPLLLDGANRVLGGKQCSDFPAVGAIRYDGDMHCTGSVIGKYTVLTAAHCVAGYDSTLLDYVAGPNAYRPAMTYPVKQGVAHADYKPGTYEHNADVAVLYLSTDYVGTPLDIDGGGNTVLPTPVSTATLRFVGYGYMSLSTMAGWTLGKKACVDMTLSDGDDWFLKYGDATKNTCNGDSGGPAIMVQSSGKPVVVGITSWGNKLCDQYGYDVRVSKFYDWIRERIDNPPALTTP